MIVLVIMCNDATVRARCEAVRKCKVESRLKVSGDELCWVEYELVFIVTAASWLTQSTTPN